MKQIFILGLLATSLAACNKKKNWRYFNEDGLVFVSYEKAEKLKFQDTANYIHSLTQYSYARDFKFINVNAIYGGIGPKAENYLADYGFHGIGLTVRVKAPDIYSIEMANYHVEGHGKLPSPLSSITVNGRTYSDVYPLIAQKWVSATPAPQAILYWNKEYGVIQLLFPSGKAIVRVD